MISTALALAMSLQGATESAIAIKNDDPETWVVEYPRLIRPQVVAYRNCLSRSNRVVRGQADFEIQHRADLPRCAEIEEKAKADAGVALAGAKTTLTPEQIEELFSRIGQIHVARGRDLDNQFTRRLQRAAATQEAYANSGSNLLLDRSVREANQEAEESSAQD